MPCGKVWEEPTGVCVCVCVLRWNFKRARAEPSFCDFTYQPPVVGDGVLWFAYRPCFYIVLPTLFSELGAIDTRAASETLPT